MERKIGIYGTAPRFYLHQLFNPRLLACRASTIAEDRVDSKIKHLADV